MNRKMSYLSPGFKLFHVIHTDIRLEYKMPENVFHHMPDLSFVLHRRQVYRERPEQFGNIARMDRSTSDL